MMDNEHLILLILLLMGWAGFIGWIVGHVDSNNELLKAENDNFRLRSAIRFALDKMSFGTEKEIATAQELLDRTITHDQFNVIPKKKSRRLYRAQRADIRKARRPR
jgi:hypothetical protein